MQALAESNPENDSHQRFYDLVQKVYFLKLQNGDLNQYNYGDVMSAVEDVMHPVNLNLDTEQLASLQANWTKEMKDIHKDIVSDFKSGSLKWRDISLHRIQMEGKTLITRIKTSTEAVFVQIRDKLFSEAKADLSKLKTTIAKGAAKAKEMFNRIFNKKDNNGKWINQ